MIDSQQLQIGGPRRGDGAAVWRLVRHCSELDLNSSYAYLLLCDRFSDTCSVARVLGADELVGAVLGFRTSLRSDTLFIWQVAVHPEARGVGLARQLLASLLMGERARGVRYVEAHVTPENRASEALFRSFARSRRAAIEFHAGFAAEDFPERHAAERLMRIGPLGPTRME